MKTGARGPKCRRSKNVTVTTSLPWPGRSIEGPWPGTFPDSSRLSVVRSLELCTRYELGSVSPSGSGYRRGRNIRDRLVEQGHGVPSRGSTRGYPVGITPPP